MNHRFPIRTVTRWLALGLGAALLASCAALPGSTPPQSHRVDAAALGLSDAHVDFPHDDWWRAWHDPELDRLQQQLWVGSPDLALARDRLREAEAAAAGAGAALLPHLDAGVQSTRQRFSANELFTGTPLAGAIVNDSQLQLQAGWQLDFFGRNAAALQAARGRAAAAAAQAQAARVLLSSALAARYVQLAGELEQQALLQRLLSDTEQAQALAQRRAAAGLEPLIPARQLDVELQQARQQLEQQTLVVALSRNALAALLGAGPQATAQLAPRLQQLPEPALPATLPAALLGRRADVVAARWQAEAAQAGVREARAAFYPDINLRAFAGYAALNWGTLTQAGSRSWGVGPAISLPLFEGGALTAQLHGAEAGADAAVDQYNKTVVGAVREVADALARQAALQRQLRAQLAAVEQAGAVRALQQQRYDAGLVNREAPLQADAALARQQLQQAGLRSAALGADVALIQALGGGWTDR